jgi:hypothetical protein
MIGGLCFANPAYGLDDMARQARAEVETVEGEPALWISDDRG